MDFIESDLLTTIPKAKFCCSSGEPEQLFLFGKSQMTYFDFCLE